LANMLAMDRRGGVRLTVSSSSRHSPNTRPRRLTSRPRWERNRRAVRKKLRESLWMTCVRESRGGDRRAIGSGNGKETTTD
jgi:hypothetical protein